VQGLGRLRAMWQVTVRSLELPKQLDRGVQQMRLCPAAAASESYRP